MKKYLPLFALLALFTVPARANVTAFLDAGQLTAPVSSPMTNGSLLLLIDLGASNTIDNTLTPGNFVSGTNFILAAGGFNTNGGTNETNNILTITSGSVGDDIVLRWFPQITFAQYTSGSLTLAGDYFGTYAPTPLGSTPADGGSPWTLPSSGTINLDFFTSNSDGGGNESPGAGFTNFQVIPEPSTFALFGIGSLALFLFARHRKAV